MEWNCWWSVNTITPFLFESSGDSEDPKSDVHVADESESVLFRFDDENDVDHVEDDHDDDAQSCSYDHSSYFNTRSYGDDSQHDKPKRLYYDDDHGNIDDGGDDDDDDNQGESKPMDSSNKRQKISHEFCGDLLNQREIDRKFWEACLAS